jgi:hypothetical protein
MNAQIEFGESEFVTEIHGSYGMYYEHASIENLTFLTTVMQSKAHLEVLIPPMLPVRGKNSVSLLGKTTASSASSVELAVPTSAPSVSTSSHYSDGRVLRLSIEPALLVHQLCALARASNFTRQLCVCFFAKRQLRV